LARGGSSGGVGEGGRVAKDRAKEQRTVKRFSVYSWQHLPP